MPFDGWLMASFSRGAARQPLSSANSWQPCWVGRKGDGHCSGMKAESPWRSLKCLPGNAFSVASTATVERARVASPCEQAQSLLQGRALHRESLGYE